MPCRRGGRDRTDLGATWHGALATCQSGAVDLGRVRALCHPQTLGRKLRAIGYRKLSARPRHRDQKPDDIVYLKSFAARLAQIKRRLSRGPPVELWWQDEACIGQQTSSPGVGQSAALRTQGSGASLANVLPPQGTSLESPPSTTSSPRTFSHP